MRYRRDVGVAGDLGEQVARRRFPPVDLAVAERRLGRERVERQPFDAIEMDHLGPRREAGGAPWSIGLARSVFGKAPEGGAGAADMLAGQKAIGAAADDLLDRLVGRGR